MAETWIIRSVGSACLAWLALSGVVYLITYVTRRRAEHGWLAAQSLFAMAYPLYLVGLAIDLDMLVAAVGLAATASVWFTRAHFRMKAPGSSWWILPILGILGGVLGRIGWVSPAALGGIAALVVTAAVIHQLEVLWRLARGVAPPVNARILLAAWLVLGAAVPLALVVGPAEGIAGLTMFAFLYTVALARQHGMSLEDSERQRRELERKVAEIETLNQELRRQIGLRSRQLASALATLGERTSGLAVGSEICGRYRMLGRVGSGGMGVVYEVERLTDARRFALKLLYGHAKPGVVARFAREAEILAQLHHPNLVGIADVDVTDGQLFIVMELVDGTALDLADAALHDVAWRVNALAEIAAGLAAIHASGIVHRDLKPANVLVSRDGREVKIADFGVSSFDAGGSGDLPTIDPLTKTGVIMGTPGYIAPELVAGARAATCAVDLFSFGVLAYELLAGQPPFAEAAFALKMRGLVAVPRPLGELVHACLAWDPAARPAASTVVAGLRALPALPAIPAPPLPPRAPTAATAVYRSGEWVRDAG